MTPLYPSYVKWDSQWRPAGKQCTILATLESTLPWIGSWATWMTQVCRAVGIHQKANHQSVSSSQSSCSLLSDWLQTSQPPWCCQAAALAPGPLPQRASLRSTWQPSSPWASAETRQPKHFEPRLESNSVQLEMGIWLISQATGLKVELCQYRHSCPLLI